MTDQLPAELMAVVARIELPDGSLPEPPPDITGQLRALLQWWQTVAPGQPVVAVDITTDAESTATAPATQAITAGIAAAESAIDGGATLLVPRSAGEQPHLSRTVIALLTRKEASAVIFQPTGMADREWMAQCAAVRDTVALVAEHRGDPVGLLDALPSPPIAYLVGILLGASARRTPCLVDGTDELAAALIADRISYRARTWWRAGSTSPDPARRAAIERIDVVGGLPLDLTDDRGRGAQTTIALLRTLHPSAG